jgi:uncharacterized protein involved in exopolysaccharide biosynthesis
MWSGEASVGVAAARLRAVRASLWAGRWRLAICCLVSSGCAFLYAESVPAQFVARVDVVITARAIANDGPEDVRHFHQISLDSEQAATELRVLKSDMLLRPVFRNLALENAPELLQERDGFWSAATHYVHLLAPDALPDDTRERAYSGFLDRTRCLRLGLSYVFEISYRSHDPLIAARVANAVAAAYLADRIERERVREARSGGSYRAARGQALAGQWRTARVASTAGVAPSEDLPAANARVLGPATPPLAKSYPKTALISALGMGVGLLFGVLWVLAFGAPAEREGFGPYGVNVAPRDPPKFFARGGKLS